VAEESLSPQSSLPAAEDAPKAIASVAEFEHIHRTLAKIRLCSLLSPICWLAIHFMPVRSGPPSHHIIWLLTSILIFTAAIAVVGGEIIYDRRLARLIDALPGGCSPTHIGCLLDVRPFVQGSLRSRINLRLMKSLELVGQEGQPFPALNEAHLARLGAMLMEEWDSTRKDKDRPARMRTLLRALPFMGNRQTLEVLSRMVKTYPTHYPEVYTDIANCKKLLRERVDRNPDHAQLVRASSASPVEDLLRASSEQTTGGGEQLLRYAALTDHQE
jgi:hypothetical protein